jgi:hypothetical protein
MNGLVTMWAVSDCLITVQTLQVAILTLAFFPMELINVLACCDFLTLIQILLVTRVTHALCAKWPVKMWALSILLIFVPFVVVARFTHSFCKVGRIRMRAFSDLLFTYQLMILSIARFTQTKRFFRPVIMHALDFLRITLTLSHNLLLHVCIFPVRIT